MKNFGQWDSRKFIFIVGGILILAAVVIAVCEYGGITNYIETWP